MLLVQMGLEILLDLWDPCLVHLNLIYHNPGAGGVQGATLTTQLVSNSQHTAFNFC